MLMQVYPNNEVRVTLSHESLPKTEKEPPIEIPADVGDAWEPPFPLEGELDWTPELYLDFLPASSDQEQKYSNGMGRDARRQALRLGALFAPAVEGRAVFCTGTLPGSTTAALHQFAANSSNAVKRVQNSVASWCGHRNAPLPMYLWVWELQGRGALHMHAVFEFASPELASEFCGFWPSLWRSVLIGVSRRAPSLFEREDGGDWRDCPEVWQCPAEMVEKDCGRYLSKYLAKDAHQQAKVPRELAPSGRWWGCSRAMRKALVQFIDDNSFYLDCWVNPGTPIELVGEALRSVVARYAHGKVLDCSRWFQSVSTVAVGYLRDGVTMASELANAVVGELSQLLFRDSGPFGGKFPLFPPLPG